MAEKVDLTRTVDSYRARKGRFRILDVPELRYLMIDGHGDPNTSPLFGESVESLYPVAYTLKFASKRELDRDYVVPPLEGLWWAKDMEFFTAARDKSQWDWTLMLLVPDWIGAETVETAMATVAEKKRPTRLDAVRLESLAEGTCVQTLHVGAFDDEAAVLAELHDTFVPAQGLRMVGRHHEIYLTDPRRTAPERRRTILRQPVRTAQS